MILIDCFVYRGWKPSKLAWPDTVCETLTSHYAVSIGRGESQVCLKA